MIKIELVLDQATIHGTGALFQKNLRVFLMGLCFRVYTAYKTFFQQFFVLYKLYT